MERLCSTCRQHPALAEGDRCASCLSPTKSLPTGTPLESRFIELSVGDVVLDHYRVEKKLGEGGMGTVLLGTDLELSRKVAIKVLSIQLCADAGQVQRFEREARLTAGLDHPNIIPIHQVGRHQGRPLMVMKYLDGVTLADWASRLGRRPTWNELRPIIAQLATALDFLHQRGLVHRDVKPANVMVGPNGHVTLLDFGILKDLSGEQTSTGMLLGTPAYMAPEQILGTKDLDQRVDVYALAVCVYRLLEGALPFGDTQGQPLLTAKMHALVPPCEVTAVGPASQAVFRRAMHRERTERFLDVQSFLDAFETSLTARPPTTPRRAGTVIAIGVALFAASVGVGAWLRPEKRDSVIVPVVPPPAPPVEEKPPVVEVKAPEPVVAERPRVVETPRPRAPVSVSLGVTLSGKSTWANAWVDGKPLGELPTSLKLTPGAHRIKIARPGLKTMESGFTVGAKPGTFRFELQP